MAAGEYLICFSEKCPKEEVKQYFVECLTRAKLCITQEEFEGKTLLTVGAPFEILAQKVSLMNLNSKMCARKYVFFKKNDLISGGGGWPAENHKEREQGKLFMKRIFNFELFKLMNI